MFTGIIETLGTVKNISRMTKAFSIQIETDFEKLVMGESIAVNGVCLTVCSIEGNSFTADVTPETYSRTSLSDLHSGSHVNLERAMKADGRIGGHIVSGHIDGTGRLVAFTKDENAVNVQVAVEKSLGEYLIEKGSVAVDGISLTIADLKWSSGDCIFTLAVIPHTWSNTILCEKTAGKKVNIEIDMIAKYVRQFTQGPKDKNADLMQMNFPNFHN